MILMSFTLIPGSEKHKITQFCLNNTKGQNSKFKCGKYAVGISVITIHFAQIIHHHNGNYFC